MRFTGIMSDITDKRADMLELMTTNSQLNLASQLSAVGYWEIDLEHSTLFWSDRVFKIHGLTPDEYEPELENAINFYHPDDLERVQTAGTKAIESGESFNFQASLKHKDGGYRIVNSIGQPHQDVSGNTVKVFGVFQDVTEDKEREDQLTKTMDELTRSNYELNRFSYVCSHDMKEPVRMIEMMSTLLLNPDFKGGDGKLEELLERIGSA